MITLEQAKNLRLGTVLYHRICRNTDGTPQRWRVNGKPKTWKTRPFEVKVPLKNGLYDYGYLTEKNLEDACLTEEEAIREGKLHSRIH